uniref:protein CFAP20DC isoform X2 n=1 Tax=Pristiophorus japonicus TaxID=55135 RepID=UPI00398F859A
MFKNEYQGGPFVEIFSSQGKDPVAKWKLYGSPAVQKVFDKEVKSYVYILEGSSQRNKMQLPKDSKQTLGLIQRFLVLQLCVPVGQDFSTELMITDLGNIKRRLYLSTIHKELSATPLHAKIPLSVIKRKIWSNICIDLVSFANAAFKGAGFQSLDRIVVSANCKLRKIFTMKLQPQDTTFEDDMYSLQCFTDGPTDMIPKSCQLGIDVDQVTQLLNVVKLRQGELRIGSQPLTSTDLDQQTNRGTSGARSVRNQDISHIAFGSKVLGPPPTSGRKVGTAGSKDLSVLLDNKTTRSSYQSRCNKEEISERLTGRSERQASTQLVPAKQINQESICFTKQASDSVTLVKPKDENGVFSEKHQIEQPHPPREPSSDGNIRRKLRVRIGGKEKNDSISGTLSPNHVGNGDKPSEISSISPYQKINRECEVNNSSTLYQSLREPEDHIEDKWHFPDHSEDSFQFISSQHSTHYLEHSRNNSRLQLNKSKKENESGSASLSEDDEKEDELKLKDIFTYSSQPRSAPHGKVQSTSSPGFIWTVDMKDDGEQENADKRGVQLEDDFHGNYSSEEDDLLNRITRRPSGARTSSSSSEASLVNHVSQSSPSVSSERAIKTASVEQTLKRTPLPTLIKTDTEKFHSSITPVQSRSPIRVDAPDSTPNMIKEKDGQASQSRTSMVKRSLKEIPKEDPRLTTETCEYNWLNYQPKDMSESDEAKMLASLRRQQLEEMEDDGKTNHLNAVQLGYCVYGDDSISTSSDDTSIWSTQHTGPPVNQGHHYQNEMLLTLSQKKMNPLLLSNPRIQTNLGILPGVPLGLDEELE